MKVTLESTSSMTTVNGVECRVWDGKTEDGIPVHAFIAAVAVHREQDSAQFERELKECGEVRASGESWPLKLFVD